MSRAGTKWAWKQPVTPAARKLVLLCLADMANDSGEVTASQERIAKATGLSNRAVIDQINALVDDGLLLKQAHYRMNGRRAVNTYYVGFSNLFRFIKSKRHETYSFEELEVLDDLPY